MYGWNRQAINNYAGYNHSKTKHNKTVCMFYEIYCIWYLLPFVHSIPFAFSPRSIHPRDGGIAHVMICQYSAFGLCAGIRYQGRRQVITFHSICECNYLSLPWYMGSRAGTCNCTPQIVWDVIAWPTLVLKAGTTNYIPQILWDVITCPCPWYLLLVPKYLFIHRNIAFVSYTQTDISILSRCKALHVS